MASQLDEKRKYSVDGVLIEKRCNHCLEWKLVCEFSKDRKSTDQLNNTCKICDCARTAGRVNRDPARALIVSAARRSGIKDGSAKQRFVDSLHPVVNSLINDPCPICGRGFAWTVSTPGAGIYIAPSPDSVSLDQIVAGAGYTPDNIQLLHYQCNRRKSDHDLESARQLHQYFARIEGRKHRGKAQHCEFRKEQSVC